MKIIDKEKNKILYNNIDKKYRALSLSVPFIFYEKLEKGFIKYIDIYLKVGNESVSTVEIDIYIDKNHKKYSLPIKDISEDQPIRLEVDEDIPEKSNLTLMLKSSNCDDEIYIWTNDRGPCIIIFGDENIEYDIENEILISIITPLYKTNIESLKLTVDSVKKQSYPKWELCLVDDGSQDTNLINYLNKIKSRKIRVKINNKNRGIVHASNDALKMARGTYVGFLDHDDLLEEHALLKIVQVLNDDKNTDLVYTDEDKVFENNTYGGPFYKSDWNYPLMLSSMYTCHFSVYRKSIIDEIGGFQEGFDGSQDYDLALKFIEKTKNIKHISEILYHWRITPDSTSMSIVNKPEARINAVRALSNHLNRLGRKAIVAAGPHQGHYDIRYILDNKPKVSIIVPFKDKTNLLKNLIETISITDYTNYEILLVDNRSKSKEMKDFLKKVSNNKKIKIIKYSKEFNFSAINNYAVENFVKSKFILFLNSDIEIMHPEWLDRMMQQFIRPEVSAVGAKLLYLDHRIQHAGIFVGVSGIAGHSHKLMWDWDPGYFSRPHLCQDITAVTGACMLIKKSDFMKVGGFEKKLPKAFNDIDLCLKLRAIGKSIVYTPYARLYHHESITRGLDNMNDPDFIDAIGYMGNKWNIASFKDPFYNPNLPRNCEGNRWV